MKKNLVIIGSLILIATYLLSNLISLALDGNIGSNLLVSGLILIIIGVFT